MSSFLGSKSNIFQIPMLLLSSPARFPGLCMIQNLQMKLR